MPVTYKQEILHTVQEEIKPLLEKHWQEIALNQEKIKLNPDWEAYATLEDIGALRIFTAREGDILAGYFVTVVHRSLHYKDHLFANNDVIYLLPEHRVGMTGPNLIRFAEKCLKEDGVSLLAVNTKCHKPFDRLLEWLGYNKIESVYSKYIGD
jgi:hypothetical protein